MSVRRRLRSWTALTLVVQCAWLFAIVPSDCCAAHEAQPQDAPCHEEAPPPHCAMEAANGAACPMHRGDAVPGRSNCRMRTECGGPMSALLSLLAGRAILPAFAIATLDPPSTTLQTAVGAALPSRFVPPDAPPPRA